VHHHVALIVAGHGYRGLCYTSTVLIVPLSVTLSNLWLLAWLAGQHDLGAFQEGNSHSAWELDDRRAAF
jgi:hypothetical protein